MEMIEKAKILVVDDEPDAVEILEEYLGGSGFRTERAYNGQECLDKVKSFKPDLILLDMRMPGMTGLDVLEAVNPKESDIAVIMVTAVCDLKTAIKSMKSGAYDYHLKPGNLEELGILANKALEKRNLSIENKRLVTELKIKNEELTELDKMKTLLTQFLVHDLKNPLTAMKINLEILLTRFDENLTETMIEILESIYHGSDQILNMVTDILTVAKLEENQLTLELSEANINDLISEEIKLIASSLKGKKATLIQELDPSVPLVRCDANLIERVIGNLLSNAKNYVPSEGTITLKSFFAEGNIYFKVKDTGDGIPKEFLPKVFDKFAQAKERSETKKKYSSGLGLSFCKMVVEAHGGEIMVESEEGKGSEFTISLPAS